MSSFRIWKDFKKARLMPWKRRLTSMAACVRSDGADDKLFKDKNTKLFPYNADWGMKHEFPIYGMKNFVPGMRLEKDYVVSLLSNGGMREYLVRNNGVKVAIESITGKYLIICCFKLPLSPVTCDRNRLHARHVRHAMIATYSHLRERNVDNFEMVCVAKMSADFKKLPFWDIESKFLDDFPCLKIPSWDTESGDLVCNTLGLADPEIESDHTCLVLDPDQVVLQTNARYIYSHGATGFPYTHDRVFALNSEIWEIRKRLNDLIKFRSNPQPVSLVELLGSDVLFSRFSDGRKISASDLSKNKCVVLYLCMGGDFMGMLHEMKQECLNENLEFEIVVVPMFLLGATTTYAVEGSLSFEHTSWWMMSSEEDGWEAARRLKNFYAYHPVVVDDLIILADGGRDVQLGARRLIQRLEPPYSFGKHYPFTRMSWSKVFFSHLRSFTLDSLLGVEGYLLSSDSSTRVSVSELKGRNVLLYLDYFDEIFNGGDLYKLVLHSYTKIQKDYPNSEVVFVPLDKEAPHARCPALPWLSLPHHAAAALQRSVISKLFLDPDAGPSPEHNLIAFGDDGLIHSICTRFCLEKAVGGDSLFDDNLLEEIFDNVDDQFHWQ